MSRKKLGIWIVGALVAFSGAAAYAVADSMRSSDAAEVGSIRDSYAFDVKDKRQLMAYADDVFVGKVEGVERTDEERSSTLWRVSIVRSVKGDRSGEALVWQLGYVDGDGRAHVAEEQDLLVPGRRYLLVTTRQADSNTLVAGPAAAAPAETPAAEARLVQEYAAAAK